MCQFRRNQSFRASVCCVSCPLTTVSSPVAERSFGALLPVQVGKLLAELVREPLGPGAGSGSSSRREVNAGSEPGTAGNMGKLRRGALAALLLGVLGAVFCIMAQDAPCVVSLEICSKLDICHISQCAVVSSCLQC